MSMSQCKPMSNPLAQRPNLYSSTEPLTDATFRRSIVGALQFLTLTRLDLVRRKKE